MPQSLNAVAEATDAFVLEVQPKAPCRVVAKVESANGMRLLCAVEAVLRQSLPRPATVHELVWLTGSPKAGGHLLQLHAFDCDNQLLAKAVLQFED